MFCLMPFSASNVLENICKINWKEKIIIGIIREITVIETVCRLTNSLKVIEKIYNKAKVREYENRSKNITIWTFVVERI